MVTFVSVFKYAGQGGEGGRILVVMNVARVTVCDVDGLGSKEADHRSFVVVTVNRGTGQG